MRSVSCSLNDLANHSCACWYCSKHSFLDYCSALLATALGYCDMHNGRLYSYIFLRRSQFVLNILLFNPTATWRVYDHM